MPEPSSLPHGTSTNAPVIMVATLALEPKSILSAILKHPFTLIFYAAKIRLLHADKT